MLPKFFLKQTLHGNNLTKRCQAAAFCALVSLLASHHKMQIHLHIKKYIQSEVRMYYYPTGTFLENYSACAVPARHTGKAFADANKLKLSNRKYRRLSKVMKYLCQKFAATDLMQQLGTQSFSLLREEQLGRLYFKYNPLQSLNIWVQQAYVSNISAGAET